MARGAREKSVSPDKEHVDVTGSSVGQEMLNNWDDRVGKFVKVMPHDYKRVLMEREARAAKAA